MPEVNVQGVQCEFKVSDSVIIAFNRLAKAYFALPRVQEDFERWDREQERQKAEKLAMNAESIN